MAGITIRLANSDDRPFLIESITALQDWEYQLHDSRRPGAEVAEAYLNWLLQTVVQKEGQIAIAQTIHDAHPVGFGAWWISRVEEVTETEDSQVFGYISDLYIAPDYRGERIINEFLEMATAYFQKQGITRIRLTALANNQAAIKAYQREGFTPYELQLEKKLD